MHTAPGLYIPVELETEFLLEEFRGMKLRVVPVSDSAVHRLSSTSQFPLTHLRVLEVGYEKLTMEDLRCKNIALEELQDFLESEKVQELVTPQYLPSLTKDTRGWNVSINLRCAPGHLYVDIVVGHIDVLRKLKDELMLLTL